METPKGIQRDKVHAVPRGWQTHECWMTNLFIAVSENFMGVPNLHETHHQHRTQTFIGSFNSFQQLEKSFHTCNFLRSTNSSLRTKEFIILQPLHGLT